MSATSARALRAPRCLLSSPASRPALLDKAAVSSADTIMIDLEDAVFPEGKHEARAVAAEALERLDWGDKRLLVRCNGLDTEWGLDDLLVLSRVARLDGFLVPKVEARRDIDFAARLLGMTSRGRERGLELHILIETARGVTEVESILGAAPLVSASFGSGDYAISVGSLDGLLGIDEEDRGRLPFEHAKAQFVTACHAHGVTPLDGPFPRVADTAGCREAARLGRALGFTGKWAIHPGQIPIVNETFGPPPEQRSWARRVIAALGEAESRGVGAVQLDGRLIEAAHRAVAERILADERH